VLEACEIRDAMSGASARCGRDSSATLVELGAGGASMGVRLEVGWGHAGRI